MPLPILARAFDTVQRLTHRAVANGVNVHQPAALIDGADQFAEMRWIDQQLALFVRIAVRIDHRRALRRVLDHAVSEDLDPGQGQIGDALKLLAHFIQRVEIGRQAFRVGDQQRCDVHAHVAACRQRFVGRQHADGFLGGFEREHGLARCGVGGGVHPRGDAEAVVEAHGGFGCAEHIGRARHRHFGCDPVPASIDQKTVGFTVRQCADRVFFRSGQGFEQCRVDAGALEHHVVGPRGVVVTAGEHHRHVGPFTLVESLAQRFGLRPVR